MTGSNKFVLVQKLFSQTREKCRKLFCTNLQNVPTNLGNMWTLPKLLQSVFFPCVWTKNNNLITKNRLSFLYIFGQEIIIELHRIDSLFRMYLDIK